ncbi:hypothetical protein SDC9_111025 [bioreactor metagenome]|uniref:Uncharacterized protein n=1 Tax=bioreactor metagenome TaxID=1076179 RepID=A0A645BFA8_9ZZZZ
MTLGEHPDGMVDFRQQPGDGGLARTGVAHKHQVQAHGGHRKLRVLPEFAHLHQIDEAFHVGLHLGKAGELVQLGEKLFQRSGGLRRSLGRRALRVVLSRYFSLKSGGNRGGGIFRGAWGFGDEIHYVQRGLASGEPVRVAKGGELVGAPVHKSGLLFAHHPIYRREEQQHEGEHVDEPASGALARQGIRRAHPGEKGGGHKAGILIHHGGELPVKSGRHRITLAVNCFIILHMAGSDRLPLCMPDAQGAFAHERVGLPAYPDPESGIGDMPAKGGERLVILFVYRRGADRSAHKRSTPYPNLQSVLLIILNPAASVK